MFSLKNLMFSDVISLNDIQIVSKRFEKKQQQLNRALTIFQTLYITQAMQQQCKEIRTLTLDLPPLLCPSVKGLFFQGGK